MLREEGRGESGGVSGTGEGKGRKVRGDKEGLDKVLLQGI